MSQDPALIVFGGSFDPPHRGHVELTDLAHQRFPRARLLVVPAFRPVLRVGVDKRNVATWEDRLAMCRLTWARNVAEGWLEVSDMESRLPVPSYTVRTLQEWVAQGKRLGLLLGLDQMRSFFQWKKPISILAMADLLVADRKDTSKSESESAKDVINECLRSLSLQARWNQDRATIDFSTAENGTVRSSFHDVYLIGAVACAASSSEIRKAREASYPDNWLNPEVARYIKSKGIY